MPPKIQIEACKHQLFLQAFRKFMQAEHAEENLLFLFDKNGNEAVYNKYVKEGATEQVNLPDKIVAPLKALAAQKKWSAMGPGLKEARKVIAANTNDGGLKRFIDSPGGKWPTFLPATGVDGSKAKTMEALMKVFRAPRTPQDKQEAYDAMLKMTNKALLNPALRDLGLQPPAPVIRSKGDPSKALKVMGVKEPQRTQLAKLIADYAKASSKIHRATILDQMEVVAKGVVKRDLIVAGLKSSGLYTEQ
jgi:hypothetical protein